MRPRRRHSHLEPLEPRQLLTAAYLANAVTYATASNPTAIAVGDFDGDGAPDLAVAATNSHCISLLLNLKTYDGSFAAKTDIPTGTNPIAVSAGDINGDGKLDLVVAEKGAKTIGVFLGNGNGTFAAEITTPASPDGVNSLTLADFDGDGKLDVATTTDYASLNIFRSNGDGTFQPRVDYFVGVIPSAVATGDFNGDGKTDVAVTRNMSTNIHVLINKGDGTFFTSVGYTVGSSPMGIVSGDFDADGARDLAVVNSGSGTVSILRGNGNGTFAAKVDYRVNVNAKGIVAADFDGNGKLDLAVFNNDGVGHAAVLKNLGNGTFQASTQYAVGNAPGGIATGDFNLDGRPDLVVSNTSVPTVTVLINGKNGVFADVVRYTGYNSDLTLGNPTEAVLKDFNGDGWIDVALTQLSSDNVAVMLNSGDGTFGPFVIYPTGKRPEGIAAGDFDKDGDLDLVTANSTDGTASVLLNNGDGTFAHNTDFATPSGPDFITAADFNGDGNLDIAVDCDGANSFAVLFGNGAGAFGTPNSYLTASSTGGLTAADLNADGRPDIIVNTLPDIRVYLNSGSGTFPSYANYTAGSFAASIKVADVNNDGRPDLLSAEPNDSSVIVLLNKGGGLFDPGVRTVIGAGMRPSSIAVADFNSDGKMDLLVGDGSAHLVSVLLGNNTGIFNSRVDFPADWGVTFVAAASFNNDARPDLFYITSALRTVYTLANFTVGNVPPTVSNFSKSGMQGDTIPLPASDFANAFSSPDGRPLTAIRITKLPANAKIYFSGGTASVGQIIALPDAITFASNGIYYGVDTFQWEGFDGLVWSSSAATVTVTLSKLNHTPTNVNLSNASIAENTPVGTTVGTLSAVDQDAGDTFTYSLVGGDTSAFTLTGNLLKTAANFNFETKGAYSISLRATDQGGLSYDRAIAIAVTDVNEAPSAGGLARSILQGNSLTFAASDFAATFNDPDTGATPHTLSKIQIKTLPAHGSLQLSGVNVTANQEIPAASLADLAYVPAAYSGTDAFAFTASDGSLYSPAATVSISISAPEIAVSGNGINIGSGDYTPSATDGTNFGSALITATPVEHTFTISNAGTVDLVLGSVTVPAGYILSAAPSGTVSPGGSTTFKIAMDMTAAEGTHKGVVTFATNDLSGGENPFTFTITSALLPIDESTKNTVKVAATKPRTTEYGTAGLFTFTRAGGILTSPLIVNYQVGGTATSGADYVAFSGQITFAADETIATLALSPILDSLAEGTETVSVTLLPDAQSTYKLSTFGASATATIADAASRISVSAADPTASEINGNTTGAGRFLFRRTGGSLAGELTINYTLAGTASNDGSDFPALSGQVTFAAGASTATVYVLPIDDFQIEGRETGIATVAADPSYFVAPTLRPATITIADNNRKPVIGATTSLVGASAGVPFVITYADLISATGVVDSENQPITIKIVSVLKGKLLKNGLAVRAGVTTLTAGESLTWIPPLVPGTYTAFKMTASDGVLATLAVPISILVG